MSGAGWNPTDRRFVFVAILVAAAIVSLWAVLGGGDPSPRGASELEAAALGDSAVLLSDQGAVLLGAESASATLETPRASGRESLEVKGRIRIVDVLGAPLDVPVRAMSRSFDDETRKIEATLCFDTVGEAPHLLEISAGGYATTSVLVVDDALAEVVLRRSGSVEVEIRASNGPAVIGRVVELIAPHADLGLPAPLGRKDSQLLDRFHDAVRHAQFLREERLDERGAASVRRSVERFHAAVAAERARMGGSNVLTLDDSTLHAHTDQSGVARFARVVEGRDWRWIAPYADVVVLEPPPDGASYVDAPHATLSGPFEVRVDETTSLTGTTAGRGGVDAVVDLSGFARIDALEVRLQRLSESGTSDFALERIAAGLDAQLRAAGPSVASIASEALDPGTYRLEFAALENTAMFRSDRRDFDIVGAERTDLGVLGRDLVWFDLVARCVAPSGARLDAAGLFEPDDRIGVHIARATPAGLEYTLLPRSIEAIQGRPMRFDGLDLSFDRVSATLWLDEDPAGWIPVSDDVWRAFAPAHGATVVVPIVFARCGELVVRLPLSEKSHPILGLVLREVESGFECAVPTFFVRDRGEHMVVELDEAPAGRYRLLGRAGTPGGAGHLVDQIVVVEQGRATTVEVVLRPGASIEGTAALDPASAAQKLVVRPTGSASLMLQEEFASGFTLTRRDGGHVFSVGGLLPNTDYVVEPLGTIVRTGDEGTATEVDLVPR